MFAYTTTYLALFLAVIADCGSLPDPANGDVSYSSTLQGSVATYTCSVGREVFGVSSRTCPPSGDWSGDPPICVCKFI